jgi:soluble lytic murein transglycosylase-like protein
MMQMIDIVPGVARGRVNWLPWIAMALALSTLPVAYVSGRQQGQEAQETVERNRSVLEHRIVELIVERNPGATIRDFADFPAALLQTAEETQLDFRILLAIADKESGFRPDAVGRSGEVGLMQLLPSTAELVVKRLGVEYTPPAMGREGRYVSLGSLADPRVNVRLGATYLRWQIDRYGFNETALRAYNRNPDRALELRPHDRYAEDVSFRFLAFAHALR